MNGTCCCVELTVTEDAEVLLSVAEDSQVGLDVEEQFVTGGGITPSGTKTISVTQNGTTNTDVTYYANAKVVANVPNSYAASDEGKVVQDGDLESQTTATFEANDTYDTTTIKRVTVDVPASAVDSGYVYINENDTVDVVGYAQAVVNVPNTYEEYDEGKVVSNGELVVQTSATVRQNGRIDTTLINSLMVSVSSGGRDMTPEQKDAILALAEKVAYIDDDGQELYEALQNAFYPPSPLASISAVYTQSGTVYPSTSLDSLKSDLVVTATYEDQSSETIPSTDYTLSGTLSVGTSTVTVTYEEETTTFSVTVSAAPTVSSISAVYTQSGTVYDTDSLDSLKSDLVVTATLTDSSTMVVPSADYTLSGTLTAGTSTITVTFSSKTTTFTVTVTSSAPTVVSITAVYTQSGTVYNTDSLDSLKTDLVVTATWSDTSTTTVASTDYTLSGTLTVGTSTITATYEGKTDSFSVTVSAIQLVLPSVYINTTQYWYGFGTDNANPANVGLYPRARTESRRTICYDGGNVKFKGRPTYGSNTNFLSCPDVDFYPIPIPQGATTVTVTCPDAISIIISTFDLYNGYYAHNTNLSNWDTASTTHTQNISAYNNGTYFIGVNINSTLTDVTGFNVEFS